MTPEDARELLQILATSDLVYAARNGNRVAIDPKMFAKVEAALAAEEREACAKIAANPDYKEMPWCNVCGGPEKWGDEIAAAIRARA